MASKQYKRFVHYVIFLLALLLFFKIVMPIATIFLSSILITYISYPIYRRLRKHLPREFLPAFLTLVIITLIFLIPLSFFVYKITQQTYDFYTQNIESIQRPGALNFNCTDEGSHACIVINSLQKFTTSSFSRLGMQAYVKSAGLNLLSRFANYLLKLPAAFLGIGISLFISYFLFKDWDKILNKVIYWLPFRQSTSKKFVKQFQKVTYSIVYSQILVAMIQGVIGIIGFYIFGAPFPIILGITLALFALIPTVGTAIVWAPISIFMFALGYYSGDSVLMWKSAALFAYGVLVISTIDNVLRIYLIQSKADVHPIIIIAGVIGGVSLFGMMGLFLGPILLSLLLGYFDIFRERFI